MSPCHQKKALDHSSSCVLSLTNVIAEEDWAQKAILQGQGEDNSASEPSDTQCFGCSVESRDSCLFDDFSSLDNVFKQVSSFGPVFLQNYL